MNEARVVAVTPSGSMGRVLSDLRGELYRRWGAVSALALPPVVPIRRWPVRLEREQAAALLASAACPIVLALERYERVGGWLTLILAGGGVAALRRRIDAALAAVRSRAPDGAGPELFPVGGGFLLAGPDLAASAEEVARELPLPEERSTRSYALSVLCVRWNAPPERWWDCTSWEEELSVPVKSSGRPSPGSAAKLSAIP